MFVNTSHALQGGSCMLTKPYEYVKCENNVVHGSVDLGHSPIASTCRSIPVLTAEHVPN